MSIAEGDQLEPAVEALLRAESWDTLTVKVVMKKLEQGEGLEEGTLKPHKAKVKEAVDAMMKKILAERAAAEAAAAPAEEESKPEPEAAPAEEPKPEEPKVDAPPAEDEKSVETAAAPMNEDKVAAFAEGDQLEPAVEALVRAESWDTLTVKVVMKKLEQGEGLEEGALKPHKAKVKEAVDAMMKKILAERAAAEAEKVEAAAEAEAKEEEAAPPKKKQKMKVVQDDDDDEEEEEAKEEAKDEPMEEEETEAADGERGAEAMEEEDDEEDDPDEARVISSTRLHKIDGKQFYKKMKKGDETLELGQDVYLENNQDIPYVARLQEIFTYSFAPKEVYFNARWYYREADVHEYAKMHGARGDVEWEGDKLVVEPTELFFSMHLDENHADCILRSCVVHLVGDQPGGGVWAQLKRHEYLAWRAYDTKHVYGLGELPSKKLRDAYAFERKRSLALGIKPPKETERAKPKRAAPVAEGPLSRDELRAAWLPRKHLEVYYKTDKFAKVVTHSLVRCGLVVNGQRTFFVGYCVGLKRAPSPYRVGKDKEVIEVALQVRTHTGVRMTGLDTLSNVAPTDAELDKMRLELNPQDVRKKISKLQQSMSEMSDLFDEEDKKRQQQQAERLQQAREEQERAAEMQHEEQERKEREREELRHRAAQKAAMSGDQWWLSYQNKGGGKQREKAKWQARLKRFLQIVESSTADGERENAQRLAEQAQAKLDSLEEPQDDDE